MRWAPGGLTSALEEGFHSHTKASVLFDWSNTEDQAFALVNALDATQKAQAVLGNSPSDLVLGPGRDGKTIQAERLPASAMTAEQQAMLLLLISKYTGLMNDENAAARMADVQSHRDPTNDYGAPLTSQ